MSTFNISGSNNKTSVLFESDNSQISEETVLTAETKHHSPLTWYSLMSNGLANATLSAPNIDENGTYNYTLSVPKNSISNVATIEREYSVVHKFNSITKTETLLEKAVEGFKTYGNKFNLDSIAFTDVSAESMQTNAIAITYNNPNDNKDYMFQGAIMDLTYNNDIYQLSIAVHPNDKVYPNGLPHPKFSDDLRHFHVFPDYGITHNLPSSELNIDCFEIKMYEPFTATTLAAIALAGIFLGGGIAIIALSASGS